MGYGPALGRVGRYETPQFSSAALKAMGLAPDGSKQALKLEDFVVESAETQKVESGNVYPSRWRVKVPGVGLDLEVIPKMAEQEMSGRVPYWEGAVKVEGSRNGQPIEGHGFVELTGYGR